MGRQRALAVRLTEDEDHALSLFATDETEGNLSMAVRKLALEALRARGRWPIDAISPEAPHAPV